MTLIVFVLRVHDDSVIKNARKKKRMKASLSIETLDYFSRRVGNGKSCLLIEYIRNNG